MANNCSKIILDAHSATANPLKTTPASDIQQLPPPPIWTAMVKGTLEYLRLAWDCLAPEEPNLGIFVAGQRANCICTEQAGDCTLSKVSINLGKTGPERLHDAPEKLRRSRWHFVLGNAMTSTIGRFNAKKYSRIILLLMSDGTTSMESQVTALSKDIVTTYIRNQNCYEKIDFNVVRICWEEKEHLMPDMHKRLLNDRVNVYVHNVPVSMDDIMQSMRNLAQLHCSLKSVRITQIPMNKTSSADLSTQQVTFLYRDTNLSESEKSLPSKRLFDPVFWGNRERELVYVKRSKRPIQMNGWCTRILSLVAADLDYAPAEVYIKTTLGGSSSYLVTSEAFRGGAAGQHAYTHTLVGDNGKLLLCIYEQVEDPLEQLEFVVKKEEGGHQRPSAANVKSEHLLRDVVAPSTDQMPAPSLTVERDPLQYAPQASYHTLLQTFPPMTALWSQDLAAQSQPKFQMGLSLEKSTKWLTCFRDSVGTEEFGVEQDDRSVADTARDVANGEPLSNGYEFILDLMPPMSDNLGEIWKIMMKNQISNAEKGPIKATISNTIKELWDIMEKRSKRNLARNDLQEGGIRELTAKRILVALCLVGWRFRDDSPSHKEVCQYMLSLIIKPEQQEANIKIQQQEQQASAEDMAWQQATSYQNMTLQEQANAVYQDSLEDAPMRQMQPNPQQQQRGGRYNRTKRWPDHTVIQPYLNAAPASKEEREQRAMHEAQQIGPPGSALWYINTMRAMALSGKRSGDDQDDGTILSYKKGRWIRRQKEFDGYLGY